MIQEINLISDVGECIVSCGGDIGLSTQITDSLSDDIGEIKKELEHLRRIHDYDYACKCVLEDLEKQYQEMIRTDIWYEAAKDYLYKKIDTSKFDNLFYNYRLTAREYPTYFLDGELLTYTGLNYTSMNLSNDIIFTFYDKTNNIKKISIKDLHNPNPDVELDDKFKMHCLKYKANNEKE
jgi:hypothetical protein